MRKVVAIVTLACGLGLGMAAAAAPDEHATTEALLRDIEGSPRKDLAAEMVARSRAALERAASLRGTGDEPHAKLADGLARTWAEAARDVVRAVEVEEKAQAARRAATDAGVVAERERALLEEGIAQSGRLRAQLEGVERDAKEQPARTSAAANLAQAAQPARSLADSPKAGADGGAAKPKPRPVAPADGGAR